MKILRKLALVWMFAWLPISGVMATTMPFCAQGMMGVMQAAQAQADDSSVAVGQPHCDQGQQGAPSSNSPVCEHCDLCHIAGALVPPSLPMIANAPPSLPPSVDRVEVFSSFIPNTPQHPPLSTPA